MAGGQVVCGGEGRSREESDIICISAMGARDWNPVLARYDIMPRHDCGVRSAEAKTEESVILVLAHFSPDTDIFITS
jgi:hypothetical protein